MAAWSVVLEKDGEAERLSDEELPDLPRAEVLGDVGSDGDDEVVVETRCTWRSVLETVMGLVNPFADAVEVEDFFAYEMATRGDELAGIT